MGAPRGFVWTSSRDRALRVSFVDAARTNVPPGGGLYVPSAIEPFTDVRELLLLPWRERSIEILSRLASPELDRIEVAALVDEAFDFRLPLVAVPDARAHVAAFELWHGPTLSFKDVGVRFLAALLSRLALRDGDVGTRTVLTATSGDTGAAVAHAFHGRAGFRVAVLYPSGRISNLQERQIATLGGNVRAFAVAGSFDDCQALVKGAFADPELAAELGLLSANSIHVARLLAQVLYYFEIAALARSFAGARRLVISVPSGNFGNLYAGLLARALGAPIAAFVAGTNANATVPEHLESGHYCPRPSVATLSNAMDVGDPGNWERVLALFDGDLDAVRAVVRSAEISDEATRQEIRALASAGYRADPHGAVASAALRKRLGADESGVFLATAHPAKFAVTLEASLPLPPALAAVVDRPLHSEPLEVDSAALARTLRAGPADTEVERRTPR